MSLSFTNTVINSLGIGNGATLPGAGEKKVQNLGNITSKNDPDQLVTLRHTSSDGVTNIFANTPPNFNLELQAEWAQRNGSGPQTAGAVAEALGKVKTSRALDAAGFGATTLKYLTAHYWEGSAPIRCTLPFEFIAEDDAEMQVIKPLVHLYKMAAPSEKGGFLIPPGPSVIGTALSTGENVTIKIGNILTFNNVIINSISGEIDTRLSFKGSIMHAKVDVSFTSFFTVSRQDISEIFGAGGGSEDVGQVGE